MRRNVLRRLLAGRGPITDGRSSTRCCRTSPSRPVARVRHRRPWAADEDRLMRRHVQRRV